MPKPAGALALFALLGAAAIAACSGPTSLGNNAVSFEPRSAHAIALPRTLVVVPASIHLRSPAALHIGARHIFPRYSPGLRHAADRRRLSQANMTYHGGIVQTAPSIYVIYWGFSNPPWNDATHDPKGMTSYLHYFLADLECTAWINTDTQYNDTAGYITNPCVNPVKAEYVDPSPPPSTYTQNEVAAEAASVAAHYGYDRNANYFVVTPTGTKETDYKNFCAYHSYAGYGSSAQPFTLEPYIPDAGVGCGQGSVNSPGILDGVSITAGHEEAETQTDPLINAWYDTSYTAPGCSGAYAVLLCEIGDKCAWTALQNTSLANGGVFPTQPLWSNANGACVQNYGTPAPPTPSPTPSPNPTTTPTPMLGPVKLLPHYMKFTRLGVRFKRSMNVTQPFYTGAFTRTGTCGRVAGIRPVSDAGGRAVYSITPLRAGSCTVTITGGASLTATLHIYVTP